MPDEDEAAKDEDNEDVSKDKLVKVGSRVPSGWLI